MGLESAPAAGLWRGSGERQEVAGRKVERRHEEGRKESLLPAIRSIFASVRRRWREDQSASTTRIRYHHGQI